MSNIQAVQEIYNSFGKGDIPTIIEKLDENIEWEYTNVENNVPWLKRRHGKDGAMAFFESLGQMEISNFAVKQIFESGNIVIALIDIDFTVKSTGKSVHEVDEAHIWHFNDNGKVIKYAHRVDTYQQVNACNS